MRILAAGHAAAYLDVDQLGLAGPARPGHDVRARMVAALWRNDREAGADVLVVVGPAPSGVYAQALGGCALTVVRLHAGPAELAARIGSRGEGRSGWHQPGDPLLGRPAAELRAVAARAAAEAAELERAAVGHRIRTDDRPVADIAAEVVAAFTDAGRRPDGE
jgi:hypothetical protein